MSLNFLAIIPARHASTRFPAKPLVRIQGKTMIARVWEQASKAFEQVLVATDHPEIEREVLGQGGQVAMTPTDCPSGTDRCALALDLWEARHPGRPVDVVVNLQGDEPFVHPESLRALRALFDEPETQIGTLAIALSDPADLSNPNRIKLTRASDGHALYFSRSPIPFLRGVPIERWPSEHPYLRHMGIYAYRAQTLRALTRLPQSPLERAESLEQLRWLENGYRVRVAMTPHDSPGIDSPEDLHSALEWLGRQA